MQYNAITQTRESRHSEWAQRDKTVKTLMSIKWVTVDGMCQGHFATSVVYIGQQHTYWYNMYT